MLKFKCSNCHQNVVVATAPSGSGERVRCPRCGAMVDPNAAINAPAVSQRELLAETMSEEQQVAERRRQEEEAARQAEEQQQWARKLKQRQRKAETSAPSRPAASPGSRKAVLGVFVVVVAVLVVAGIVMSRGGGPSVSAPSTGFAGGTAAVVSALARQAGGAELESRMVRWIRQIHRQEQLDPGLTVTIIHVADAAPQGGDLLVCRGQALLASTGLSDAEARKALHEALAHAAAASEAKSASTESDKSPTSAQQNVDLIRKTYDAKKFGDASLEVRAQPAAASPATPSTFDFAASSPSSGTTTTSKAPATALRPFLCVVQKSAAGENWLLNYFNWDPDKAPPILSGAEHDAVAKLVNTVFTSMRDGTPVYLQHMAVPRSGGAVFPAQFRPMAWTVLRSDRWAGNARAFVHVTQAGGGLNGTWIMAIRDEAGTPKIVEAILAPS